MGIFQSSRAKVKGEEYIFVDEGGPERPLTGIDYLSIKGEGEDGCNRVEELGLGGKKASKMGLLVVENNKVIAFITMKKVEDLLRGNFGKIEYVYVSIPSRKKGICTHMMSEFLKRCHVGWGLTSVYLDILSNQPVAAAKCYLNGGQLAEAFVSYRCGLQDMRWKPFTLEQAELILKGIPGFPDSCIETELCFTWGSSSCRANTESEPLRITFLHRSGIN